MSITVRLGTPSSPKGKLQRPPSAVGAIADGFTQHRLHVIDKNNRIRFLVDTGADISLLPKKLIDKKAKQTTTQLYAANGVPIKTFGERLLTLNLGLRRQLKWIFCVTEVSTPILRADFLYYFYISVNLRRRNITGIESRGQLTSKSHVTVSSVKPGSCYHDLLAKFPELTKPPQAPTIKPYGVYHHIHTKGLPIAQPFRRLLSEKLKIAKAEFKHLIEAGICRPSASPWATPLHLVPKKITGVWRSCGDYRGLNVVTTPDKYPLPHIFDFAHVLHEKNIFSTLDLEKACHHIPVAEEDVQKTAVTTPFSLFEFTAMPFGLKNAAQTFQRFMNSIFQDLDYVYCYVDDILIASETHEQHL